MNPTPLVVVSAIPLSRAAENRAAPSPLHRRTGHNLRDKDVRLFSFITVSLWKYSVVGKSWVCTREVRCAERWKDGTAICDVCTFYLRFAHSFLSYSSGGSSFIAPHDLFWFRPIPCARCLSAAPPVIQLRRPCCGAAGGRIKHHIGLEVVRLGNQAEDVESGVCRDPGGRPPGARRWAQRRIRDELTRLRGGSMPSDVSMQLQDLMEQLTSAADKVLGPGSGNSSVTEARPQ
jgi:hypothetical protein